MKRGPKKTWCYVCQQIASMCHHMSPCNRLPEKEKKAAYGRGYAAKNHDKTVRAAANHYRKTHPNADPYRGRDSLGRAKADKEADQSGPKNVG